VKKTPNMACCCPLKYFDATAELVFAADHLSLHAVRVQNKLWFKIEINAYSFGGYFCISESL
jgi:hypothetical protein